MFDSRLIGLEPAAWRSQQRPPEQSPTANRAHPRTRLSRRLQGDFGQVAARLAITKKLLNDELLIRPNSRCMSSGCDQKNL